MRRWIWPALVSSLPLAILGGAGCYEFAAAHAQTSPPAEVQPKEAKEAAEERPLKPLLEGWEKPAAVLLLSAEMNGYLEPCGCSVTQSGGVSRRNDLFQKLTERGWPVAGLDAGNFVKRSRTQDKLKYETILASLRGMNYQSVGVGPADLRLGPDFLLTQQVAEATPNQSAVALTSSNVVLFDSPDLGTPIRTKFFKVGEITVGVTSVLGKSRVEQVAPGGAASNITLSDPEAELRKSLATLKAGDPALGKPKVMVLLSQGSTQEARDFAMKFPEFQLIVTSGGPEDPEPKPIAVEHKEGPSKGMVSWIVLPGQKGKHVAVVGVFPDDPKRKFRYELVDLDNRRFNATAAMEAHMADYQNQLRDQRIAESPELVIPDPSAGQFVGAAKCGECHTKAFDKWEETPHAHAFASIKKGRSGVPGHSIPRIYDPECLSCHVTGWEPQEMLRYESGYRDEMTSKHLLGNQCENCHGPGSRHVATQEDPKVSDADRMAAQLKMQVTMKTARERLCFQCHDVDNSPGFKFDEYWKKVAHPWRD